jgi:hypothetical protein
MRDRNLQLLRVLIREEITRAAIEEGLWDDVKAGAGKIFGKFRGRPKDEKGDQSVAAVKEQTPVGKLGKEAEKLKNVTKKLKELSALQDTVNSFYQDFSTLKDPHQAMSTVRARVANQISLTKKVAADAFDAYAKHQGLKEKDDDLVRATTELIGPSGMHEVRYKDKPQLSTEEEKFIDAVRRMASVVSNLKQHALFRRSDASDPYARNVSSNLYNEVKNFSRSYADIIKKIQNELIGPIETLISILEAPRAARKPRV